MGPPGTAIHFPYKTPIKGQPWLHVVPCPLGVLEAFMANHRLDVFDHGNTHQNHPKTLATRKTCPNTKLLFMEEILNNHRLDVIDNLVVHNGISYQPQLGSRISEPSTVPLWTCYLLTQVDQVASPSSIICSQTKLYDVCRITSNDIRSLVVDMFPFHGLLT